MLEARSRWIKKSFVRSSYQDSSRKVTGLRTTGSLLKMKVDSRTLNSQADALVKHTHAYMHACTQCTHTLESIHTPAEELSTWREGGGAGCQLSPCVHCIKPELFLVLFSQSCY